MEQDDLRILLESTSEDTNSKPQDSIPSPETDDASVDEDDLGKFLLMQLKNDVADKEHMGWAEKREYDIKAYDGIKEAWMSEFPWHNSSNYPVPITPVQVDTATDISDEQMWRNKNKACVVGAVGAEDIRDARNLESILSWQIYNDIPDMKSEWKAHIRQGYKHGTSPIKVIRSVANGFELNIEKIPVERIYLPIDAKSPQIKHTDHITQCIPLTANDLIQRVIWGVYKNMDQIAKGWNIGGAVTPEKLAYVRQQATGLDIVTKLNRDSWWIAETYITYYPKASSGPYGPMRNFLKARELIVTWAPTTGKIMRVIENSDGIRPYSFFTPYPNDDMIFGKSIPEKIRHVQEKANYTDKQVTDAGDKALSPAGFYDGSNGFDPSLSMRAPTGMYPVKNVGSIQWEQVNIGPIIERKQEIKELWLQAERLTGFTDLFQGVNSGVTDTLGQDQMRAASANRRLNGVIGQLNQSYHDVVNLIYKYDDKYMPRDTKIQVLGTQEFSTIERLFEGQQGQVQGDEGLQLGKNFNFSIANKSVEEDQKDKAARYSFADVILTDPIFGMDKGNRYKALEMKAEAANIRDLAEIVTKPQEAFIISPQEVVNRIMNGEKDVQPSVYVNPTEYENRIRLFMRTGNFREAGPEIQQEFGRFLMLVIAIRKGREAAFANYAAQTRPVVVAPQPGQNGKQAQPMAAQ